jgi:RNA recognition motif-containing protein
MNLYVGRLPRTINETKLRELFEQYGPVTSIKLIKDKFTGALKGFAFIEMPENENAQEAISALNGMEYEGQRLVVSEARPREERPMREGGASRFGSQRPRFGGNNRY